LTVFIGLSLHQGGNFFSIVSSQTGITAFDPFGNPFSLEFTIAPDFMGEHMIIIYLLCMWYRI